MSQHAFNADAIQYRSQILSNGIEMAYLDAGTGEEVLLFIHGLGTYSGTWWRNMSVLSEQCRCIAVDLPGNGFSEKRSQPYGMEYFATCVYDFIRKLGLKKVRLCGHSMGGQVAMHLALKHTPEIQGLILCAPAGFEAFSPWERNLYRSVLKFWGMFSNNESSLRSSIYSSFYENPSQADELIKEMVQIMRSYSEEDYRRMAEACIDAMLDEPVYERLSEINLPTLVLFGEMDALIPNQMLHPGSTRSLAQQAVAKMPHAQLKLIPYAGHFIQWEKADIVNAAILQFLKNGTV
jgi:pimeloyl-ACP methyl ester carboxylesterase